MEYASLIILLIILIILTCIFRYFKKVYGFPYSLSILLSFCFITLMFVAAAQGAEKHIITDIGHQERHCNMVSIGFSNRAVEACEDAYDYIVITTERGYVYTRKISNKDEYKIGEIYLGR